MEFTDVIKRPVITEASVTAMDEKNTLLKWILELTKH